MQRTKLILLALASVFSLHLSEAQPLPDDLRVIAPEDVPVSTCNFYSIANWSLWPPCPANVFSNSALYYSPSVGTWAIFADDRELQAARLLMSYDSGDDGGGYELDGLDPVNDATNLYISLLSITNQVIEGVTNLQAQLVIRNTTNALPYEILSSLSITNPMSNWISEGVWIGLATNTPANVPMGGRTNQNFFRAKVFNGFSNGISTNGELFLLLSGTNSIQAVVNGLTNTITPFYGSYAMARLPSTNGNILPTYNFNAGYDHSDNGDTNYLSDFAQQHIQSFFGFSTTASNIALSYNPLTNIDVRGWPKLYDLECWHCTNLLSAKITGCPQLHRICLESTDDLLHGIQGTMDYTGCTNLADVRCANNAFTNIVFGDAGAKIFHFCTRDTHNGNSPRLPNINFSQLPSLKELWIWRDYSFVQPLILTHTNCPQLGSVEAYANYFHTADVSGQTNLDYIYIDTDVALTNLNIAGCTKLRQVRAYFDSLPAAVVDSILINLDKLGLTSAVTNGLQVQLQGNAAPSAEGMKSVQNLISKGWNPVFYTLPPVGTPEVSNVAASPGSNYVTITWTTDISSDSTVYYSTDGITYSSTNVATTTTSHSVTVTGLSVNTTYYFYVHSTSGSYTGTSGDSEFTTRGGPGIYFANSSGSVNMQVRVTGSPTITWYWGDGGTSSGATPGAHSIAAGSTNYVSVVPASALTGFGVACGNSYNTTLTSVWGLTNYQNLQGVYLYTTALANLSLAGCTNLTYAALVGCTNVTTATANAWFNDLADAQANISHIASGGAMCSDPNKTFFCPVGKVDSGSAASRSVLAGKDWDIQFY